MLRGHQRIGRSRSREVFLRAEEMTNAQWTAQVLTAVAQMPGFIRLRVTWKIVGPGLASSGRIYARAIGPSLQEMLSGLSIPDKIRDLEIVVWGFAPETQSSPDQLMLAVTQLLSGVDTDDVAVDSRSEGHGESIYRITIVPGANFSTPPGRQRQGLLSPKDLSLRGVPWLTFSMTPWTGSRRIERTPATEVCICRRFR
jgi:hypothetical protein